ncbi:MAG: hypothetical protein K6F33_10605 [Bacteroidales bacterium]|nr:hypothetical protein [Bacteroidales bacterium]
MANGNTSIDPNVHEEALKLQTAFLKTISHEIRTPLNVIVGCCDVLSLPDCDNETREMLVVQLKRSVRYLLNFCDNAAFINSLEVGNIKPHPNVFDVIFTLDFIYNSTKSLLVADKRNAVCYVLNNSLGDSQAIHLYGDDSLMCHAITLIVENAIKFTEEGTVTLSARFHTSSNGTEMLEFQVADTGIGIDKEYHQSIFNKFWKVPQTGNKIYDGAGIGLAIAKQIVDMLDGEIELESTLGVGSIFTVRFPITRR